jgi:L-histidine N-alpha-methyltransferase
VCYSPAVTGTRLALEEVTAALPRERFSLRRVTRELARRSFAEDVRAGLTAPRKFLPPKHFYDELGSRLFEAITALPEYYLTRCEAEILEAHAGEIATLLGGPVRVVELGSGDGQKTRLLLESLLAVQGTLEYVPIDISESAVTASSQSLLLSYPGLRVTAWVGEYHQALQALRAETWGGARGERTLALFLGSTIGNLDPAERLSLLREVRALLRPGDAFLLGVDLEKPEDVLIPAYDDSLGVTAAFNLNLLVRINRELGGGFDLAAYRHRALYNRREGRIEMHLESRREQAVPIRALGIEVPFAPGETIHTENSYKLRLGQVAELAVAAGFRLARTWTDSAGRFASGLLAVPLL